MLKRPLAYFSLFGGEAAEAEVDGERNCENLGETPQHLRDEELVRTSVMGNEAVAPHCRAEGREAQHHEPARVELAGQKDVYGHAD